MKKMVVVLLSLSVLLVTNAVFAEQVELVWYHCCGQQERMDVFDSWANEFERLNPDIKIQSLNPPGSYNTVLQTSIAAGAGPDIFWSGIIVWKFADLLLSLDDLLYDPAVKEIVPSMINAFRWKGKLIAIPYGVNVHTIYYNKSILEESGISMPQDWDWNTAISMGKQLQKDKDGDGNIDQWGFTLNERYHALTYAGNVFSPDGRSVMINNPVNIIGMQTINDLLSGTAGIAQKYEITRINQAALLGGQLAMGNRGVFDLPIWRDKVTFNWDVTKYPKLVVDGKTYRSSFYSPETWGISSSTKYPEQAKRFLRFILQKDQMLQFGRLGAVVPTQSSVAVQAFLNTKKPSNLKAFTDSLNYWKNGQWAHPAGITFETMQPWIDMIDGTISATSAVPELARLANALLDEYWAKN